MCLGIPICLHIRQNIIFEDISFKYTMLKIYDMSPEKKTI